MSRYREAEIAFRAIGLPTRTINALIAGDVYSLDDLSELTLRDIQRMAGVGQAVIGKLLPYLNQAEPEREVHTREKVVAINFPPDTLNRIEAFAEKHPEITSKAGAVRRLVEIALASEN